MKAENSKTELLLKKTSLSLYGLTKRIETEKELIQDEKAKTILSEIQTEIKNIDAKLLKDFKVKFTDKTKSEILKFL